MRTHSDNLVSLLAGAAAGAVAMYLLDPEQGPERRATFGGAASDAMHTARAGIGSLASKAQELAGHAANYADAASEYGKHATGSVSDATEQSRATAKRYLDQARKAYNDAVGGLRNAGDSVQASGSSFSDTASNIATRVGEFGSSLWGGAREKASDWSNRGTRAAAALRGEPEHSVAVPVISSGVGFLALGAGLMWLFDPEKGRGRRAYLSQKTTRIVNDTGRTFRGTGRHLRNKISGMSARAQTRYEDVKDYAAEKFRVAQQSVAESMPSSTPSPTYVTPE